jgi:ubiquinone/menaquinone biosynthesis C-methylase UbiE
MENEKLGENIPWNYEEPTPLIEQVFEQGIIRPGDVILDAGCGFGRNSNWLASNGVEVYAININEPELEKAKEKAKNIGVKVEYVRADVLQLPFADQTFDSVIDSGCTHQLSAEQQVEASREINRVLKPSGYIIYFGFSKNHPAAKEGDPMYRDLEDEQALLGESFEVVGSNTVSWTPKPEENANFSEHVGINAVLKKKEDI